jgi:hypothetical protein
VRSKTKPAVALQIYRNDLKLRELRIGRRRPSGPALTRAYVPSLIVAGGRNWNCRAGVEGDQYLALGQTIGPFFLASRTMHRESNYFCQERLSEMDLYAMIWRTRASDDTRIPQIQLSPAKRNPAQPRGWYIPRDTQSSRAARTCTIL